ncbi:MAG: putative DNA-binding domain-containing protein [Alphaproteobacteria bacterium]|nr:putative DNA-binding domain-containing protein [Alphaproteobacteria bacterium]MCW5744230.1 putative DNA-binding domain-containing protein [Alphaproteobacteria bacterium]
MSALALAELQSAFRAVCLGRDAPDLAALVDGADIGAEARLRIYRHHVFDSLATALGATFSTVQALVGEAFFRGLARQFIALSPPSGPVLSEYGAEFAVFIERHQAARELVYLADAARLDWALTRAYGCDAGAAMTAAHLAAIAPDALGDLRLRLRAGVTLLRSAFPIDRIWAVSQGRDEGEVDLASGGVELAVFQRDDDAAFARMTHGEAVLLDACDGATSLADALERATAADPSFDLSTALPRFLNLAILAAP